MSIRTINGNLAADPEVVQAGSLVMIPRGSWILSLSGSFFR